MGILNEYYTLSNGVRIPKLAIGTWQVPDGAAVESVGAAFRNGYRHVDSASSYKNEKGVGKAVRESGIPRAELFVTTKIPAEVKSYKEAKESIQKSLENLNVNYIDLMLIHAPKPWKELFGGSEKTYFKENIAVWRAMEEAYKEGKLKAIGISNFNIQDIQNLTDNCGIKPMVNQIKFHIGNTQDELTAFCQDNGILVEGYSPMSTGAVFDCDIIAEMAKKYGKSISQLCIRYVLQRGVLPLPKSTHEEYIIQNAKVDFVIADTDMAYLNSRKNVCQAKY